MQSPLENVSCSFCKKTQSQHICPRCSRAYCTPDCYRSRGHRDCIGGVQSPLATQSSGRLEEKDKIKETLRKYDFVAPPDGGPLEFVGDEEAARLVALAQLDELDEDDDDFPDLDSENVEEAAEEDEDEDDEESATRRKDLETRMTGLNIEEADFEDIWERLDSREREEFVKLARELEKSEQGTQDK
jgi:hypothetical protein